MAYEVEKSEQEWRSELSPAEYQVLREAGTERPGSSPLEAPDEQPYTYSCRACGAELFRSATKFDSHCGWPSFYAPLAEDRVEYISDRSLGTERTEVRCARCGSHLGHVFSGEGYGTPTDLRYCINGIALRREEQTLSGEAGG
ncbi:MAG TPA: peptide-methionine (R)-S-oxide reductase MsrB [Jiangellaceae bacterium]|nr:peptide-methionine (R)-S-oxide reductase MsrB [Jiangellaceae bacterium]